MGAPKTQTVGGGSATPTADAYNQFLKNNMGNTQTAIGDLLSGKTPSPGADYFQNGGKATLPNAPSFASTDFTPMNTGLDLSKFNSGNVLNGMPSMGNAQTMMSGATAPLNGNFGVSTGPATMDFMNSNKSNYGVGNVAMPNADVNSPRAQAIKAITDRQNALNLANTRARFSAGGMGSLGSGAGLAEAQTNAEGQNQLLAGLQGITQQDIGNTLNFGQLNTSNALQSQGMQGQDILSRLGLSNQNLLGNRQISSNEATASASNALSAAATKAGLSQQGIQSLLNYVVSQGGLGLQGLGMDTSNAMNQFGMNNAATQTNNSNAFSQNQSLNNFMQQLFGQNSSNALQNQSMSNNLGLGLQGNQMQGIMGALSQMFGGYNQAANKGVAGAQTIQTPNAWQQAIGGINDVMGIAKGVTSMFNPLTSSVGNLISSLGKNFGQGMNPGFSPANGGANLGGMYQPAAMGNMISANMPQFTMPSNFNPASMGGPGGGYITAPNTQMFTMG